MSRHKSTNPPFLSTKEHEVLISPRDAVILRPRGISGEEYYWAMQIAEIYQAVPLETDGDNLYRFIIDVFNAGRITGKRMERMRAKKNTQG